MPKTTFAKQSSCAVLQAPRFPPAIFASLQRSHLCSAGAESLERSARPEAELAAAGLPSLPAPMGVCTELGPPLPPSPAQTFLRCLCPQCSAAAAGSRSPGAPPWRTGLAVSPLPGLSLEPRLQPVTFTAFCSPYRSRAPARVEGRGRGLCEAPCGAARCRFREGPLLSVSSGAALCSWSPSQAGAAAPAQLSVLLRFGAADSPPV